MTLDLTSKSFSVANAITLAQYAKRAYSETTISDVLTDTQVLVSELVDEGCIVVAFRGTSSIRNFITDAEAWRAHTPLGEIHRGFWEAWLGIANALYRMLQPYSFKPVILCGHSLGGSLAMIAARVLRQNMVNVHSVYTFGAPRVGDLEFQTGYNSMLMPKSPFDNLGDATFTLIHDCDLVPRIPSYIAGFHRPGRDEFISVFGSIKEDPSIWFRLVSDVIALWEAWNSRRDPLFVDEILTDHHIDNYLAALAKLAPAPVPVEVVA